MRRAALTLAALLALAGSAAAYWTSAGTSSGQGGTLAGPAAVTVSASAAPATLIPTGAPTGEVAATLTNPNAFPVTVRQLELDPAGFSANAAGCDLSFATQDNGGTGWTVPASGSLTIALPGSLTMGTAAADGCQGQTFTVFLRAS